MGIALEAFDRYTKPYQEKNKMVQYAIKCMKCCLFCLEKCLKFITNYCYIYVAMQGSGFCRSCVATFKLIMGNAPQLAINPLVSTLLTLLHLVGIPVLCYE